MARLDIVRPCDVGVDVIKPHLKTMFEAFRESQPHLTITYIKIVVDEVK